MTEPGRTIYVVYVNYNSASLLRQSVLSIEQRQLIQFVVVDNGSSDSDLAALKRFSEEASIRSKMTVLNSTNQGFGGGLNRAVEYIAKHGDPEAIIVCLNPDTRVRGNALQLLANEAGQDYSRIVAPMVVQVREQTDYVWYAGGEFDLVRGETVHWDFGKPSVPQKPNRPITFVSGAAFAISLCGWQKLGGFDESLFLYWEDAEFSLRALREGFHIQLLPTAKIEHLEGGSSSGRGRGSAYYYYMQKNRIRVLRPLCGRRLLFGRGAPTWIKLTLRALREPEDRFERMTSAVKGVVAGAVSADLDSISRQETNVHDAARYYHTLRSAHVEREIAADRPALLLYSRAGYDLDFDALGPSFTRQCAPWQVLPTVHRYRLNKLEINEPLMVSSWPSTLAVLFANAFSMRRPLSLRSYAIENNDPSLAISAKFNLPYVVSRFFTFVVAGLIVRSLDLLIFGTTAAEANYRRVGLLPEDRNGRRWRTITALPSGESPTKSKLNGKFVFASAFEPWKSPELILRAFSLLAETHPSVTLDMYGVGSLERVLINDARSVERARVAIGQSRSDVLRAIQSAQFLVSYSIDKNTWREQVGLSIVEGLSVGCIVVCSDTTGLAGELDAMGHVVLPPDLDAEGLRDGLARALDSDLTPNQVMELLPLEDGRATARRILDADEVDC